MTRLRASYTIAAIYELRSEPSQALKYVERAVALSVEEPPSVRAFPLSLRANLLVAEGRFEEAERDYREALRLGGQAAPPLFRMIDLENIGYCRVGLGDLAGGITMIRRAAAHFRAARASHCEVTALSDLAFALLLDGAPLEARLVGERGLALVDESPDPKARRNLLYLVGLACARCNDDEAANQYIDALVKIRPDLVGIRDQLVEVDLLRILNLRSFS